MTNSIDHLFTDILTDPDPVQRQKRVTAALQQITGILARQSFAEFVQAAWHVVEPSTELEWNWHHQLMCDTLQAMYVAWDRARSDRGRRNANRHFDEYPRNAVFNVPPGSLKSRIIAVCFQPWCWLHESGMKFICLSVNEDASLRDGRMSRDLIKSEWYQRTFQPKWSLKTDQDAISNYGNSSGGERLSRASGSEIVGLRADCVGEKSLISTEFGQIPIKTLHEAAAAGLPLPKVWTVDNFGKAQLNKVLATRKTSSVKTLTVRTANNNVLTCTNDHRIYTGNEYIKARDTLGAKVSIMSQFSTDYVLQQDMCRETPFNSNGRQSKPSFQEFSGLRRESVAQTVRVNQGEGRERLCSLWGAQQFETATDSTSHRSQPYKQYLRELNNALRSLPHDSPQIETSTVLSVDETPEARSGNSIDVYDLHVEGIHNFIANGITCCNCLLIDDANNPKEAENKLERTKINDLWTTNQFNRVNDPRRSLRIGVQQRVHSDDWTGYVIKNGGIWSLENLFGWLHVVLPAEYEAARKFVMPDCLAKLCTWPNALTQDPRIVEGESVHPTRFTSAFLESEKLRWKNTAQYAGQMQQRPALLEGTLVQRRWFNFFRFAEGVRDDLPVGHFPRPAMCHDGAALTVNQKLFAPGSFDFDWITLTVDPAAKKTEKGSLYGLLMTAGKGGRRFVLDDRSQRGAFHEIIDVMKDMIRTWRPDSILIEPKAAGPDIMDTLREQMYAGDVPMIAIEEAEPGNQDKEMRLQSALNYLKNGAVYLLDGASWLGEFVNELATFPNGSEDDRVDALSQLLNSKRELNTELPDW